MKFFIFTIMSLLYCTPHILAAADNSDLDQFPLISENYVQSSHIGKKVVSNVAAFGMNLIGFDVVLYSRKKIDQTFSPYLKYFPPGVIHKDLHSRIVSEGFKKTLSGGITNQGLSELIKYTGTKLFQNYLNAVFFNVAQLKDQVRNKIFITKMLLPFEKCVSESKDFMFHSTNCLQALVENTNKNGPSYIVYEYARKASAILNFTPNRRIQFALGYADMYRDCYAKYKTDIFVCTSKVSKNIYSDVFRRKIDEIFIFFPLKDKEKEIFLLGTWLNSMNCISELPMSSDYNQKLITCLVPAIDDLKNLIIQAHLEQKSKVSTLEVSEKVEANEAVTKQLLNDCILKFNHAVIYNDGFSFLESNYQILKNCVYPSSP